MGKNNNIHNKIKNSPYVSYFAVSAEPSYYVPLGTSEMINEDTVKEILKTGKYKFSYTDNMHFETETLKCKILKKITTYEWL